MAESPTRPTSSSGRHTVAAIGNHAAAQRLAQHQNIWHDSLVFAGEQTAGFAQPGGNFVENQQSAASVASLAHDLPETGRRKGGHGAAGSAITAATSPSRSNT